MLDGLEEISNSFVLYPKKISWVNFASLKPVLGLLFLVPLIESWDTAWIIYKSIIFISATLQAYYFIIFLFHILETYKWKLKEMNLIMKNSKSILTQNIISESFFDEQIDHLILMKRSNRDFNKLGGEFIIRYIVVFCFNLFHCVVQCEYSYILTVIAFLVSEKNIIETYHSYIL